MNTQLTTSSARDVYSKIDNPMTAMIEMGKLFHQSGIMGVSSPGDGAVVALTCICEGITPMEFARTYHIIKGRPSMRADMMSAKFRAAGGKVNWKNLGDDGKLAEAEFVYDDQTQIIKYTIEDADLVMGDDGKGGRRINTPDSNWRKDRGAMLRARLITKAIRIMAPEIIAGVYTPEELDDSNIVTPEVNAAAVQEKAAKRVARKKELEEMAQSEPVTETTVTGAAPATSALPAETESAPFETAPEPDTLVTPALLNEFVGIFTKPPFSITLKTLGERIMTEFKVTRPQEATQKQIRSLIEKMRSEAA